MYRKAKDSAALAKKGEEPAKNNIADRKISEICLKVPFVAVPSTQYPVPSIRNPEPGTEPFLP